MNKNYLRRLRYFCTWLLGGFVISAKRRRYFLVVLSSCAVVVIALKWGLICMSIQPWLHIRGICASVASGQYMGNVCAALCQTGEVSSLTCQTFYMGKEAVFSGQWQNKNIIFKSPKLEGFNNDLANLNDHSMNVGYLSEPEFIEMIKANIKIKFNITITDTVAQKMSRIHTIMDKSLHTRDIEMNNIWLLMQDNEYLALILYKKFDVFPKLIGSCGSLYAVEMLNSLSGYSHLLTLYDSKEEWHARVKLSLMMLQYLRELEQRLPEPMYICDIKMSHFGVTEDTKRIKYLDLDSVHPRTVVNKITGDGSRCTEHGDCDFFDCRSFCNQVTSKCTYGVVNNNLQMVCERVFLGWVMSRRVLVPGLLLGPRTPRPLLELLELCANPAQETGAPRAPASPDLFKRLTTMLTHVLLT